MNAALFGFIPFLLVTNFTKTLSLRCSYDSSVNGDDHWENENSIECSSDETWCMLEYSFGVYFKRCVHKERFYWSLFCDNQSITLDKYGEYAGQCNHFTEPRLGFEVITCCCQWDHCNAGFDPVELKSKLDGSFLPPVDNSAAVGFILLLFCLMLCFGIAYNSTNSAKRCQRHRLGRKMERERLEIERLNR